MGWDIYFFRAINELAGRFDFLDKLGVFCAVFLLPLIGFLIVLSAFTIKRLREEHWYEMPIKAAIAGLLSYVLRWGLGELIARPRPFNGLANAQQLIPMAQIQDSFPSGHSAIAFALAFTIFRHDRDWGIAFLILAALVAFGRVFVGVHYPLDVLGGAVVGWLGAWIVQRVEREQWGKFARCLKG